jgi:hypothetical protein
VPGVTLAILRSSTPPAAAAVAHLARSEFPESSAAGTPAVRAGRLTISATDRSESRWSVKGVAAAQPSEHRAAVDPSRLEVGAQRADRAHIRTCLFPARANGTATWAPARLLAGVFWRRGSLTSSPREASKARSPVADAQGSANKRGEAGDGSGRRLAGRHVHTYSADCVGRPPV